MNVELSNNIRMNVRDRGEGAPIWLLLHGWAVSGALWEPVLERWPEAVGRVLAPDLRGTGFTTKPRQGYSLDDYAGDIVTLIDTLALSDVVLVGHSLGGTIAQRVALARPDQLRVLVLVSPVPASGVSFTDDEVAFFRSLGGHRQGAEQILATMMAQKPAPEVFERMVSDVATVAIEAYLGGFDAWRTASFADRIGNIHTPTLVLGGSEEQPLTPEVLNNEVVTRIPQARFEALPGVGHYPQVECPDRLTRHLVEAASLAST